MNNRNYWQQFLDTGRVEDYLKFRNEHGEMQELWNDGNVVSDEHIVMGDKPYAGIGEINGNGFKDSAYR